MSANTSIEWTETTWNPVRGCSRISPGCVNCYAERIAARFSGTFRDVIDGEPLLTRNGCLVNIEMGERNDNNAKFYGFAAQTASGPRWTGRVELIPDKLTEPLRWKKPRKVFVNSMSDLFHENLPDEAIDQVFAVMALCPQHTFQVLTKRAKRMREYFGDMGRVGEQVAGYVYNFARMAEQLHLPKFPLPNVHLGVSVENQKYADERIPDLLATPAAVRWISAEPLLGEVDLRALPSVSGIGRHLDALSNSGVDPGAEIPNKLDWIVIGGESGPGARPLHIAWARSIVQQCKAADVPVFMKQIGAQPILDGQPYNPHGVYKNDLSGKPFGTYDRKGGDYKEWPEDLRVREYPA